MHAVEFKLFAIALKQSVAAVGAFGVQLPNTRDTMYTAANGDSYAKDASVGHHPACPTTTSLICITGAMSV